MLPYQFFMQIKNMTTKLMYYVFVLRALLFINKQFSVH